jgi:predicted GNAT superfamily acetyltransferase
MSVRELERGDLQAVVALNNAHSVEIGLVASDRLARLLTFASLARAIGPAGDPDAFLIAFDETVPAQGPNHAYFLARHSRFLYIDRVCVHPRARRRGLARALYEDAGAAAASRGVLVICCEVNTVPPNPCPMRFTTGSDSRRSAARSFPIAASRSAILSCADDAMPIACVWPDSVVDAY